MELVEKYNLLLQRTKSKIGRKIFPNENVTNISISFHGEMKNVACYIIKNLEVF